MNRQEFRLMEVRPQRKGWYYVTLYQFNKPEPVKDYVDYFKDWLEFDGRNWLYADLKGRCYVCFIHKKEL